MGLGEAGLSRELSSAKLIVPRSVTMNPTSMRRFLILAAALLFPPAASSAQEILSFEPGGHKACAAALHRSIPPDVDLQDTGNFVDLELRADAFDCASRDLSIEKKRLASLARLIEQRSPEERVAYNALTVSFTAFLNAHMVNETCRGGTICGTVREVEQAKVTCEFLLLAGGSAKRPLPAFTAADLTQADAALNTAYAATFATFPKACLPGDDIIGGCTTQATFRETQRDWIRFRDSWVTFAGLRWPQVSAESWLTLLTRERTAQIDRILTPP